MSKFSVIMAFNKGQINGKSPPSRLDFIGVFWPPMKGGKEQVLDTQTQLASFIEFVELGGNNEYLSEIKNKLL
ncbi:hypothetical protein ACS3CU_001803 [Vibrio parahaemolyticus]